MIAIASLHGNTVSFPITIPLGGILYLGVGMQKWMGIIKCLLRIGLEVPESIRDFLLEWVYCPVNEL